MTKKQQEQEIKKDYAYRLYLSGETQKYIALKANVTEATISRWVTKCEWEKERQEQNTSTMALANSMMSAAKKMSELIIKEANREEPNLKAITQGSDNLVKIMASAERITKTITSAMVIDVIIDYEHYLMRRADTDKELTAEKIDMIHRYNQEYIKQISSQD